MTNWSDQYYNVLTFSEINLGKISLGCVELEKQHAFSKGAMLWLFWNFARIKKKLYAYLSDDISSRKRIVGQLHSVEQPLLSLTKRLEYFCQNVHINKEALPIVEGKSQAIFDPTFLLTLVINTVADHNFFNFFEKCISIFDSDSAPQGKFSRKRVICPKISSQRRVTSWKKVKTEKLNEIIRLAAPYLQQLAMLP